ncbi:MAG: acyl-CoA thioesterase [Synergistaceae bacterium]|nr:acyl-CoA thioesterase [Synergistaceae bacterium]MBQ6737677.1 acyl-CoA thioesterase [Synergistaceae bacterium]MBR0076491.1 acyl-CoA thioesterase [Synergistaceae bacterium]MBR0079983.1 acyl-CoA thioesterase [Synergistaceae bacterium]MBR0232703.1 acyl-CoA thioesterase [Synergistaceae bacterium]
MKQSTKVRVRYGETDKMGVAYYGNYMNWFEVGRSDFCRAMGKSFAEWENEGILLPVVEAYCRYKSSLLYDEEIEIETTVTKISKVSVVFECKIFHADSKKLAAEGYTKHAFISKDGKLLRDGNKLEEWLKELSENNEE